MISKQSIQIIRDLFLGHVVPQSHPQLYATCGIPGVGKSTFVDQKIKDGSFPIDAFILNPDRVMVMIPEYKNYAVTHGYQKAYERYELPARDLSYAMAEDALSMRAHVIKDMGCSNPLSLSLIQRMKDNGYHITMYYIQCDIDAVMARVSQRDFQISSQEIISRLHLLETLLPQYQSLSDSFISLDNSDLQMPFQKIAA